MDLYEICDNEGTEVRQLKEKFSGKVEIQRVDTSLTCAIFVVAGLSISVWNQADYV